MPAKRPRVRVPASLGESFTVAYNGDEPVTYTPEDGQVSVNPEHLDTFLAVIGGSSVVGGTAATKSKE